MQEFAAGSLGPPIEGQKSLAARFTPSHHRPGPVSEEDAGVAIPPIDDRREALGSDDEDVFSGASAYELVGQNQTVKKT